MTCETIRLLLESDLRDAAEDAALSDHVAACSACAAYAAAMRAQDGVIKRAMTPKSDEVRFARLKLSAGQRIDRDRSAASRWRVIALAGGVAAMLAVCAGIYWMNAAAPKPPIADRDSGARGDVLAQVADLQTKIRASQVLDELVQLQAAMDAPEDQDGKSAAEDAELYIERILALHGTDELAYRETLLGIDRSGVSVRLRKVRDSLTADAPKPVVASLDLAISTFDQAGQIVHAKEVAYAD